MAHPDTINLQEVVAELIDVPPDRWDVQMTERNLTEEQRREVMDRLVAGGRSPAGVVIDAGDATMGIGAVVRLNGAIAQADRIAQLNHCLEHQGGAGSRPRYRVLEELGRG